ncbi:MAG: DUF192 domain-containing protein [Gemmataceae bacterium]
MIGGWRLRDQSTGQIVVANLEIADNYWSRFWGLQFRKELPAGAGMLLVPCPSVHTFWMRFAIDVLLLDKQGQVLAVRHHVRPWRVVWPVRHSHATLELPADTATVAVNSVLTIEALDSTTSLPASVAFLSGSQSH